MENVALLIGAIGGLITAITTGVVALRRANENDEKLSHVQAQVTPSNGETLSGMIEELVRSTSRRLDLHDEIITRLARRLDMLDSDG